MEFLWLREMRCDPLSVFLERALNQRSYHISQGQVSTLHLHPLYRTILLSNIYFLAKLVVNILCKASVAKMKLSTAAGSSNMTV